jgi:hypothetical protein
LNHAEKVYSFLESHINILVAGSCNHPTIVALLLAKGARKRVLNHLSLTAEQSNVYSQIAFVYQVWLFESVL